jgi:hypothetical protein
MASNRSVLEVASADVTWQLNVRSAAVLRAVLIEPVWQTDVKEAPVDETRAMQTSEILMLALVVVLSSARE